MAHINLLPWREEQRKEQQRQFAFVALGSAILAAAVVWYAHLFMSGLIDDQSQRNNFLQKEIVKVDAQIKEIKELAKTRKNLIARMRIIEDLQSRRPQIVHLFEEIAATIPEGVTLKNLQHQGKLVSLKGEAQSNARVSIYMRNLENSEWLTNPVLGVIQTVGANLKRRFGFDMKVTQTVPNSKANEGDN